MIKNTLIILTAISAMACIKREKVDLIVTNAKIYSVDSAFTVHSSMAISNGKIVAIGEKETIEKKYESTNTFDATGKYIYPGFIDPHCHFLGYGLGLPNAWLAGAKNWEEVVKRLVENQNRYSTEWVKGRGWNQNEWAVKQFPTNELLNKAFPDKPVYIVRIDGHAAIANQKALEIAGITAKTTINGGEIIKVNGKPTGVLVDNAMELVRKCIPESTKEEKTNALINAQKNCFAVGLTGVHDAGLDTDEVFLVDSLQKSGSLKMRINAWLNPTKSNYETFVNKGVYQTDWLTVRSIKIYADGALGSRGALLLKPYSDDPKNIGIQVETTEKLDSVCKIASDAGYQVCTHCIGDAAVRLMIDIYSKYLDENNDKRWRIEHSQVVDPQDMPRYGKYNIIPSIQTTHATSDMDWANERLGDRIKYAYAYQELLQQNGWLPNGSDFPIEHINPLYGFYSGVVRQHFNGEPKDGFQMENALTREQALRAMTIWAVKSAFEENIKGSLEVGKFADFVVLDFDLMNDSIKDVPYIKVQQTYINGEKVYDVNQ
ncbi:MAG TPA: amidohydrolase family protein [Tenuifilaceae bacterium]|nr:amidohydrolase family protein [Tenuifilaceae bacterium]HOZ14826.1 amidohydrolase family protein [Tenuifilaceae bacterium]HPI44816.1 amidohydrolase family protein [Tenuifilaceae bacterium]HPN21373.1 amidohydrolase family protein [Tenuifilaceae bacterium]